MPFIIVGLGWFVLWATAIFFTIYGLVTAWQASIITFLIFLVFEPLPFVQGIILWFSGIDIAMKLTVALGL